MIARWGRRIPILVLTGFLGAGKTTLLNRILSDPAGRRFGVVVNDFGDINIDAEIIAEQQGDAIALSNGCICCSMRNGLLSAVATLLGRAAPPDHIVIEASGLSEPRSIVQTLLQEGLEARLSVDCIAAVVDLHAYPGLAFADAERVLAQVAAADIVLLNKGDIAGPDAASRFRQDVAPIAHRLRLVETVGAAVAPELLFGAATLRSAPRPRCDTPDGGHGFATWSWRSSERLSLVRFGEAVASWPNRVFRAKGLLHLDTPSDRPGLFHLVGTRATVEPGPRWRGAVGSRLVLIGRTTERDLEAIAASLRACILAPAEA